MPVGDETEAAPSAALDPDTPVVGLGESFDSFARRKGKRLVGLAYALSGSWGAADDLVQDALLVAYRKWDVVSSLDNPAAWVRKVVANRAVSLVRRGAAEARALARLAAHRPTSERQELSEDSERLWREVRRLPKRQTQVIALLYYQQLSLSEIAEALGCSKATVNTHLRRARETLARRIDLIGERP